MLDFLVRWMMIVREDRNVDLLDSNFIRSDMMLEECRSLRYSYCAIKI